MKKRNFKWIILVVCIVVVLIVCGLIIGINLKAKNKELAQELYERLESDYIYPIYVNDYDTYIDSNFYNNKLVTYDDLSDESKLYYAYQIIENKEARRFDSCDDLKTYSFNGEDLYNKCLNDDEMIADGKGSGEWFFDDVNKEKLVSAYHKLFGSDKEMPLKQFTKLFVGACTYSKEKDDFICFNTIGGNEIGDRVETKFEKYKKKKDSIEIYDRYVWVEVEDNLDYYENIYYKSRLKEDKFASETFAYEMLKEEKVTNLENEELKDDIFKQGALYKHIFKKDNSGNYYWYSSERVE